MSTSGTALDRAYRVGPRVSVRPEPFGALVYDFTTRRLSFLKSRRLLDVVRTLEQHDSARAACRAAGVEEQELPQYAAALARLEGTRLIVERVTG